MRLNAFVDIFGEDPVRCPRCAHEFRAPTLRSMYEGGEHPLREQVLSGEAQLYPCPRCNQPVRVEPTLLYADIDRKQWYAVFPDAAMVYRTDLSMMVRDHFHRHMEVFCPPEVAAWAPTLRKRLVFGLASLREKLVCDDSGLDDRVVEILKWQLARDSVPRAVSPDALTYMMDADEHQLQLAVEVPDAGEDGMHAIQHWAVARASYDRLAATADLGERFPQLWSSWVVDWRAPLQPDMRLPASGVVPDELFGHAVDPRDGEPG